MKPFNREALFSFYIPITILAFSFFFRLTKLGYSEFQGDEVSAQSFIFYQRSFVDFLLTRTIGPAQFVITKVMGGFVTGAINIEFWMRLPFALAGCLTVFGVYILTRKNTNRVSASIAATLAGTSGLLIALSRTVQYQSFITLLSIPAIALTWKYLEQRKPYYASIGGVICGLGLLFHYDFLVPVIAICLYLILQKEVKGLTILLFSAFATAGVFYIPFILHPNFRSTLLYLVSNRITSAPLTDSLASTLVILQTYHSKEWLIGLPVLICIILALQYRKLLPVERILFITAGVSVLARILLQTRYPALVVFSVILTAALFSYLFLRNYFSPKSPPRFVDLIIIWFFVGFVSYGLFFSKPMTHIYTFFIPAFILVGYGVSQINRRNLTIPALLTLFVMTVSGISFDYQAFTDTKNEYPWENKNYIFGAMPSRIANGEVVQGIFGFPYKRDWQEIDAQLNFLEGSGNNKTYISNEKLRLTRYYIREFTWAEQNANYYVYIDSPQSLDKTPAPNKTPLVTGNRYAIYKY
jgi:hypothetical protein